MFKSIHILYPVFYVFCWRVGNPEIFRESKMRSHHSLCQATVHIKKNIYFVLTNIAFFFIFLSSRFFSPFFSDDKYHVIDIVLCVFVLLLCVLSLSSAWIVIYMFNNIIWGPRDAILSSRHILREMTSFIIILLFVW